MSSTYLPLPQHITKERVMDPISVSDFESFINQQIKFQEKISEYLSQVEAQIDISLLSDNFYSLASSTLHNYFLGVADTLNRAIKTNQTSLHELFQHKES